MKISVIMPSFLGHYDGRAKEPKIKLARAIQSFLRQDYSDRELIIVADGCSETMEFVGNNFGDEPKVHTHFIAKQDTFSGQVRQHGIDKAMGSIICYLDNDDMFKENDHLTKIAEGFNDGSDWVFFDDIVKYFSIPHLPVTVRECKLSPGSVGVSNIAHKNYQNIIWEHCNGYGHDYTFVKAMQYYYPTYKKITGPSYLVCHIPNTVDT